MREDVVKIRKNGEEFFVKIIMIRDDGTIIAIAKMIVYYNLLSRMIQLSFMN
jgi:hypothetical protein